MKHLYEQIDRFHLLDLKNPTHPSMFVEEASYDILILTLPSKEKELKVDAYAFVFDTNTYYYYDRKNGEFSDFETMQKVYEFLNEKSLNNISWNKLENEEPYLFFVKKDFGLKEQYDKGFKVSEFILKPKRFIE